MKRLILLGASGSIGFQSLDVIKKNGNYSLVAFSVGNNLNAISLIIKKHPEVEAFYLKDSTFAKKYQKKYPSIKVFSGTNGIIDLINSVEYDVLENALVGFVGLLPSLTVLKQNKTLLLANKESLVVGGELINNLLKTGHGKLVPIDSEHVAISKCLAIRPNHIKRLLITGSGGPFRSMAREECALMKKDDALRHPTWKMGAKITIDSATMVNKAFEIIEAYYLFNVAPSKIEVVLHDKSFVHSIVEYDDGYFLADIGSPDMRKPIAWALYDGNLYSKVDCNKSIEGFGKYNFYPFHIERYPSVKYAYDTIKNGGLYGTVFNACNEVAVYAFLCGEISFLKIDEIIDNCMKEVPPCKKLTYKVIKKVDEQTRMKVRRMIEE